MSSFTVVGFSCFHYLAWSYHLLRRENRLFGAHKAFDFRSGCKKDRCIRSLIKIGPGKLIGPYSDQVTSLDSQALNALLIHIRPVSTIQVTDDKVMIFQF